MASRVAGSHLAQQKERVRCSCFSSVAEAEAASQPGVSPLLSVIYTYIQGVPGGMDKTSGECSLC